jgi:molecular chaperone DnaK
MNTSVFGIDFGTTNSLAARVVGDRVLPLVDETTSRPHPSVVWYRSGEIVVGREARQYLDLTEGGAPPGFVRSPKMALRRDGPIFVDGQAIDPTDAVAEVLKHLRRDASRPRDRATGVSLDRAVVTIPVDFGGRERRALRQAARKAGIGVVQFVHEPVAALYAFLRSHKEFQRELARLEGRSVLVFDWGGGTLDLTLCRIQAGSIMQIANLGDNEVGGDRFDERLRNLLRAKHAAASGLDDISALEQPGMAAKLLNQCELVKINLSSPNVDDEDVIIRDFLRTEGKGRHLVAQVTKAELEHESSSIVSRGIARIDEILEQSRLTHQDIELCLATGGMVNMPAIMRGLTERFLGRVPRIENGDRIISEGAAWIAHDGLRLALAKPIELLVADSSGRGSYYPIVPAGARLPIENEIIPVANSRLFCVDPREGVAVVEFAKPTRIGAPNPGDPRKTLCVVSVEVDPTAPPLLERLVCDLQIDHDYVVKVSLKSTGRGAATEIEFHDLDFALTLLQEPAMGSSGGMESLGSGGMGEADRGLKASANSGNVTQRTNVAVSEEESGQSRDLWHLVPGDIVEKWRPYVFDNRGSQATKRQQDERNFYVPCAWCKRLISQINAEGPVEQCRGRRCGIVVAKAETRHADVRTQPPRT